MQYPRLLDMRPLAANKSFFLFGPRSTGKTTLLRKQFAPEAIINLLRAAEYLPLAQSPSILAERVREIRRTHPVVIIDEIQKLPALLDEVHHLIEAESATFVLTGSSGRKLKRGGVNLLAGRAWQAQLFPLVSAEIAEFDLDRYLLYGGLPQVYPSELPGEELDAYIHTYLREEILAEGATRDLTNFSRFLRVAAAVNAEQLNFSNVANDTGVSASSVRAWFEILNDTFLGFLLEPWRGGLKRKTSATAKFYLFDVGVWNFLKGTTVLDRGSETFGRAFEHWVAMELRAYLSYRRIKRTLNFWRTYTGLEVDFVIEGLCAVETKATTRVSGKHLRGLRAFAEELPGLPRILVSLDESDRTTEDGIRLLHWRRFVELLWSDAFG
ncbi:MAG: ATP-binding protein [Spirochaeta sp.]|nr:ATP-binding protein [Spirochaeta sp.]